MTLTAQRACLALGVLVKALSNIGNDTEATVIMDKLHRWLYKQGDGKSICLCNYDLFNENKVFLSFNMNNRILYMQFYLRHIYL